MTIAVNLGGKIEVKSDVNGTLQIPEAYPSPLHEKINHFVEHLKKSTIDPGNIDWGVYDIANQAFDAMQSTIARQKLASYPPDYTIEVARNACGTLEFDRAAEMIDLGYEKAQKTLELELK